MLTAYRLLHRSGDLRWSYNEIREQETALWTFQRSQNDKIFNEDNSFRNVT